MDVCCVPVAHPRSQVPGTWGCAMRLVFTAVDRSTHSHPTHLPLKEKMSSSDEEDNVHLESGFETTRIRDMQRVMEPLEMAVRNSLNAVNYQTDTERSKTREQFYRWLSTVSTLRSRVENQTRWPGSGFGKLLKLAHSMRVTRIDQKHKKKGWLRHDACKCQVCGTKEHECTYVIELCGSCEEEEEEDGQMLHSFHADDWLRVDVKDLTRVWERYRTGYDVLFQDSLLTRVRRTGSMPSEYLGMFATGETCLKRAMTAFQLQTLPLEICYRADMVAEEATLELRKETRDKHAMLDPDELVNCDKEDAIKALSKMQELERAVVAIDQGKAQLVKLDIEMMPEMWSQIDEAKAIVGAVTFNAHELEDDEVERKTYLMCGEIADQSLARVNGEEDAEESDDETSKGSRSASAAEWGKGFKRKNPTRKARKTAPQASRGRGASNGQAKTKQTVLGASMRTRQSKESDDEDDEEDEEVQVYKRVKRPQRAAARRHASLAESSDEEQEQEQEEVGEEEEEEEPFGADAPAPAPDPAARAAGMRIPGPSGESGSLPSRKRVIEDCYRQASAQSRVDPGLSTLLAHAALTIQELDTLTKRLRAERE